MTTVHLATCLRIPEPDPDEPLLVRAIERAGASAVVVAWDDPAAPEVGGAGAVVLRSTWNYYRDLGAFLAWCGHAAARSRLCNPLAVVRWNAHKGYLLELERAGVPIVPTAFFERGAGASLARVLSDREWSDVVIKPAVSAGSFGTRRFKDAAGRDAEAASAFLAEGLLERDMMAQPYMRSVETSGERSIVWIDGAVTHSVRKSPRFAGEEESVSEALDPARDELEFARLSMEASPGPCLYARVDVMRDGAGRLLLSELELIEPSLFLEQKPEALGRFAAAIVRIARAAG